MEAYRYSSIHRERTISECELLFSRKAGLQEEAALVRQTSKTEKVRFARAYYGLRTLRMKDPATLQKVLVSTGIRELVRLRQMVLWVFVCC